MERKVTEEFYLTATIGSVVSSTHSLFDRQAVAVCWEEGGGGEGLGGGGGVEMLQAACNRLYR